MSKYLSILLIVFMALPIWAANVIHIDTTTIDYSGIKSIVRTRMLTPGGDIIADDTTSATNIFSQMNEVGAANFAGSWELENDAGTVVAKANDRGGISNITLVVVGPGLDGDNGSSGKSIFWKVDPTNFATFKMHYVAGGHASSPSQGLFRLGTNVGGAQLLDTYIGGGRIAVTILGTVAVE